MQHDTSEGVPTQPFIHSPLRDSVTGQRQGYSFVEFLSEKNADSAIKIMNMIKLYGKPTGVNKASAHNKNLDVGANIFIGNLDPKIAEKTKSHRYNFHGTKEPPEASGWFTQAWKPWNYRGRKALHC
ncbi:hypothetical protein MJT46_017704 [Ovis ammon polii x Ovis aries]|nr:hypothetical protein MJT46_017704 [Ovis ammon polii x Ovis aries]